MNQKLSAESFCIWIFFVWMAGTVVPLCSFFFNSLHFENAHLFPSSCLPETWIPFHFIVRCPHGLTLAGIFAAWFSRISLFRCRTHRRLSCCDFAYQEERWTVTQPYLSQDTDTPRTSGQTGHMQGGQKAVERPSGTWRSSCTRVSLTGRQGDAGTWTVCCSLGFL